MKKLFALLLVVALCLSLAGCAAGKNAPETESTGEKPAAAPGGQYTWQVGTYTLSTQINIMDYIEGINWNANEMAEALGWKAMAVKEDGTIAVSKTATQPYRYTGDKLFLMYSAGAERLNYFTIHDAENAAAVLAFGTSLEGRDFSYRMNASDHYVTFELIVCFAYAMENMKDPADDPFADIIPRTGLDYIV